jgi:hypothetical protein
MKNLKEVLSAAIMILLFTLAMLPGCKKENTAPVIPLLSEARVKTITTLSSSPGTDSFSYDGNRKQSEFWNALNHTVYTYLPNSISYINSNANVSGIDSLNALGYDISGVVRRAGDLYYVTRTYDADGHLLSVYSIDSAYALQRDTVIQTWSNGNMLSSYEAYKTPWSYDVIETTYIYLTDKANSLANENFGQSYYGKSSQNLVSTYSVGGNTYTMRYEYDNNGWVAKEIDPGKGSTKTYTYY